MVRLSRIYTRTGDDGTTGLGNNARVSKASARVDAMGGVDEANAAIGAALLHARAPAAPPGLADHLRSIQNELFDLGADLCRPVEPGEKEGDRLRITAAQTQRLEALIDMHNAHLKPLSSFVLPGGTPLAAALHLARTIVRRAERTCVHLAAAEPAETNVEVVRYLNRLSDLLFVAGRVANANGAGDVLWVPGAGREEKPPKAPE